MPVIASTYYYAGILNYISGNVVWTLDWDETSPGIPPYIDNTGLPPEQVGIVFTSVSSGGGAAGLATITATVDGVPATSAITALVMGPPTPVVMCSFFDYRFSQVFPGSTSLNWVEHPVYRFRVFVDSLIDPPILLTFDPGTTTTLDQLTNNITAQLPPDFSCFLTEQAGVSGPETHLIIQRTNGTFAILDNDGTEYPNVGYNYGVLDYSGLYVGVDNDSTPESPFGELLPLGECLIPPTPTLVDSGSFSFNVINTLDATVNTEDVQIYLDVGQTLKAGTCNLPGAILNAGDSYIRLLNPSDVTVASNDDFTGLASYFEYTCVAAGLHTFKVGGYDTDPAEGTAVWEVYALY